MITNEGELLQLLELVDKVWVEAECDEQVKRRGAPRQYSQQSLFKVHVVNVCKRLWSHRSVWRLLEALEPLRRACGLEHVPDRRTLDRRLKEIAPEAERQLAALGLCLVLEGVTDSKMGAGDGSVIQARGAYWRREDQKTGHIPEQLRDVDVEASWQWSGYHGWVYGYKAHVVTTVSSATVRAVLAARVTGSESESHVMQACLADLPPTLEMLLLDAGYDDEKLVTACQQRAVRVIAPLHKPVGKTTPDARRQRAAYLTTSAGKARYQQRSCTIEPFFGTVKDLFHFHRSPVHGRRQVAALFLGVLYVWNLAILFNFLHDRPLGAVKSLLELL